MGNKILDSAIDQVTVYREGALVERIATLPAKDVRDLDQCLFDDLPACLDNASVRVRMESLDDEKPAPIACDVKVQVDVCSRKKATESLEADRDEMEKLEQKTNELQNKREMLNVSLSSLADISVKRRPQPDQALEPMANPTEARLQHRLFLIQQRESLQSEVDAVELELKKIEDRKEHLRIRISEAGEEPEVEPHEVRKSVHLRLRTEHLPEGVDARVRLEYRVPGARWFPCYSLHVSGAPVAGEMAMQAYVGQATGEDWTGVKLRLSTAHPQQWTELPELHSKRIGRQQPTPPKKGWRPPPSGVETLFADYDSFRQTAPQPLPGGEPATSSSFYEMQLDVDEVVVDAEMDDMCMSRGAFEECEAAPPSMPAMAAPAEPQERRKAKKQKLAAPTPKPSPTPTSSAERNRLNAPVPMREEEGEITDKYLDYGHLRMPDATEPRRGKLQRTSDDENIPLQARNLIPQITSNAHQISPPPSCVPPCDYDGFDYAYECSAPVDIPSRPRCRIVPVWHQRLELKQHYVTVPREAPDVFRIAKITNPLRNPLLRGPLDIFLNGEFFISTTLNTLAPQGKTDIGLGVEQAIKVARNTDFSEDTEGGLLGGHLMLNHSITIEAINNRKEEIELEVRERMPVKEEEEDDIAIKIHEVEPDWQPYHSGKSPLTRGRYAWHVRIPAGEKKELKAQYTVRISSKHELIGGNRREM